MSNPLEMPNTAGPCVCVICKKKFYPPRGLTIVQGAGADHTRVINFIQDLTEHLETEHPQESELCSLQALQFIGLSRLTYFEISDSEVKDQKNFLRWSIHQATLNHQYTDEDLQLYASRLAGVLTANVRAKLLLDGMPNDEAWNKLNGDAAETIIKVLAEMRRALQEPDLYTIQAPKSPHN